MRAFAKLNVMEPRDWCALLFSIAAIAVLGWAVWPHGLQALGLALDAGGFILVWWFTLAARDLMRPEPDGGQFLDDDRLHSPMHRWLSVAGVAIVLAGFVLQLWGVVSA